MFLSFSFRFRSLSSSAGRPDSPAAFFVSLSFPHAFPFPFFPSHCAPSLYYPSLFHALSCCSCSLLFCFVAMESHFILSSHFFFIVLHPLTCAHSRTRHAFLRHRYIFLWLPGLLQLPLLLKKKRSGRSKRSAACCPQYPAVRWIGLLLSPSSKIVNSVARVSLLAVGFGWLRRFPTSFTLRKRRRRAR